MPFRIFEAEARSILSPVSGFLAQAGFTHSLTPARNCTFGCSYCYVPSMRVRGGLRAEDWQHWGEFTTFRSNAALLLERSLRVNQTIYCSPLTDPWQPAEETRGLMPDILRAVIGKPPAVLVLQTRGPLILRDVDLLRELSARTCLRVSFSLSTDRDDIRRTFEPHCASIDRRFETVEALTRAGIAVSVAIAPILPCNPERLVERAIALSSGPIVVDPLHVRATKPSGATTRPAAHAICHHHGFDEWLVPEFQNKIVARMRGEALHNKRKFGAGIAGFGLLSSPVK